MQVVFNDVYLCSSALLTVAKAQAKLGRTDKAETSLLQGLEMLSRASPGDLPSASLQDCIQVCQRYLTQSLQLDVQSILP